MRKLKQNSREFKIEALRLLETSASSASFGRRNRFP
jgi:hypothetical protein